MSFAEVKEKLEVEGRDALSEEELKVFEAGEAEAPSAEEVAEEPEEAPEEEKEEEPKEEPKEEEAEEEPAKE